MTPVMDTKQERAFGRSVGVVLVLIGALQVVRGRAPLGVSLAAVGALLAVLGTFAPATLRVPSRLWWKMAHALGWVNSRILLSLFFFLVLTPVGLLFRLTGRNALVPRAKGTSWSPYPQRRPDHYKHQF